MIGIIPEASYTCASTFYDVVVHQLVARSTSDTILWPPSLNSMLFRIVLLVAAIALIAPAPGVALRFIATTKVAARSLSFVNPTRVSSVTLFDKVSKGPDEKAPRKIAKYDNLGDPIYEDELQSQSGSASI